MEKVKKCKYCCQEIDSKAKVCQHCGKKQSKKKLWVIAGIVAVIIIGGAIGSSNGNDGKKIGEVGSSAGNSKSDKETVYAGIGQFVEGEDWKISLLNAKTYTSIPDSSGFFSDEPDSGKKFLVLFFEAENVSDKDDYFNSFNIEAYADGYSINTEIILNAPDGYKLLSGDVAAGKKLKGYLVWQVDADWQEFEMAYKSDIWSNDKAAAFKITASDVK